MVSLYVVSASLSNDSIIKWGGENNLKHGFFVEIVLFLLSCEVHQLFRVPWLSLIVLEHGVEFNCNAIESQAMWYFIDPHELTGQQRGLATNSCPEVFLSLLCFTLSTSVLCLCSLALGTFWVLHWRLWTLSDTALLFIHSTGFLSPENPLLGLLFYYVLQFLSTVASFSPISFPASFPLIAWILLSAYWFLGLR